MDKDTQRRLIAANTRFYQQNAQSFGATRRDGWEGWDEALPHLLRGLGTGARPLVDLACGNLRFEAYLAQRAPELAVDVVAVDNCAPLLNGRVQRELGRLCVRTHEADILAALMATGARPAAQPTDGTGAGTGTAGAACCFGFMHHVPGHALRADLLLGICDLLAPGGVAVVSFWQFMHDDRLAKKARATTPAAREALGIAGDELEANDYFLGWQDTRQSWRYCHHTTDEEIDRMLEQVRGELCVTERARFSADGKSHNLNRYLVLQRT